VLLKKGQWVRVKGHETIGQIVEQRKGDAKLPEPERSYKINVEEQTLYYPPSHLELLPDPPTPDHVVRRERLERLTEAARKFLDSPTPQNGEGLNKVLSDYGFMKKQ